jgi:hypothetical protein
VYFFPLLCGCVLAVWGGGFLQITQAPSIKGKKLHWKDTFTDYAKSFFGRKILLKR